MAEGNDLALGYMMGNENNGNCNNGGMWGDGGWWAIILFAMIFGWGNGGWGGGFGGNGAGLNGALTRADLCQDMNFGQLENGVRGISQGICDSTFALNNTIVNGFNGVGNAVCNLGYEQAQLHNATQMAIMQSQNALQAQLSDCCCKTNNNIERGFADVGYRMATDTCAIQNTLNNSTRDIIDSQNAGTRAILDYLCQQETANLRAENQNLKLAASQAAQNNYLVNTLRPCPQPAYITCNPFTGTYGGYAGYGNAYNGCGCNSGCGC